MKKLILIAASLASMFLAGSCQRENLEPAPTGKSVTYEISLPDGPQTKGEDGYATYDLYYEVYRTTEVELENLEGPMMEAKVEMPGNTPYKLNLELLNDQEYTILFWANKKDQKWFNVADLRNVEMVQSASNNEDRDAFCGSDVIYHDGPQLAKQVKLTRPFAQVNIATLVKSVGYDINPVSSLVKFTNIPVGYNVFTGEPVGTETEVTFTVNTVPTGNLSVTGVTGDYKKVAMNYVLVPERNVKVYYEINTQNGTVKNTIDNVPVKKNYRTNIIGNLLTSNADYEIVLLPGFEGDNAAHVEVISEGITKNINGDYEITNAKGLAYAINNLWAQGGNFYLTGSSYDMTGLTVTTPASVSGSLNVYGETPVVTRSVSTVVITGLNLAALITELAEGSSASFSNITIDSETDFIGINNGTVGFDNCSNVGGSEPEELITNNDNGSVVDLSAEIKTLAQLQAAINTGAKIELTTPLINPKGETFTLDLKGTTVSIVDETTKNFELIKNQGTLVIKNTGSKTAAMTVESTIDSEWNRYSAVIANTVGGNLTVEGNIVLEHLGGTAMAYGIDNLTNGKGTYAVVTINGATVKSPYRAVRQFLNGVEATNELTIKAGSVIDGANKSIFFHDPSEKANTGKLVVESGAQLKGDVYLFVTEGSTQWPVSVSISSSALAEGSQVTSKNVPANCKVAELEGVWTVTSDYDAMIGETGYASLQAAIDAVQDGETIVVMRDVKQTDGILVTDKTITIDLNGKSFTVSEGASTNNRNFKINGESVVTIKNGTMVAEGQLTSGAYGTVRTEDTAEVTLENVKLYSYRGNGLNVKSCTGSRISIKNTEIYSQYSGGVEAAGGTIELTDVMIQQSGVYSSSAWNSVAIGVNGGGKVTVNSGDYYAATIPTDANAAQGTWVAYVMSSGGTLEINGGTFNGVVAENATAANACGIICADRAAVVNINGGTFNSNGAILDMRNNVGTQPNPIATLKGGEFSADPRESGLYSSNLITVPEGLKVVQRANGYWTVVPYTATVKTEAQLKEAFELDQNIVLGSNINLTSDWTPVGNAENPFNGVINGNNHKISGLKVSGVEYAAFISHASKDVVVKNLTLENVDLNSTKHAAGAVCVASEGVTLENVTVSGTIVAASYAGGILHNAANAVIKNCVNNATVTANRAGGIASWVTVNATIENVENNGKITGAVGASGIAHGFAGSIKNAVNNGYIISKNVEAAAGIAGVQKGNSTYEYCYNYGNVTSTYDNVNASAAGILGQNPGSASTLKYCANYGTITAEQSYAAGIAYSLYGQVNASYCYNGGAVAGADGAGAIAPKAAYGTGDKASYCLNAGTITSANGTVYQGSNNNVSSYYYDGTTLKNVADNSEVAEADALAVLNGGTDNDFFSTENGKITVK